MNSRLLWLPQVCVLWLVCGACWGQTELRDPTRPVSYTPAATAARDNSLQLQSVLISPQRKIAVINGKQVRENEWIDGARVRSIAPGQVVVIVRGEERRLQLKSSVRKTATVKNNKG